MKNYLLKGTKYGTKMAKKSGRKAKLNQREIRQIQRAITSIRRNNVNMTVMSIVKEAGLDMNKVHPRTFSRYINRLGYKYLQARKKGLLTINDKKLRLHHAKKMNVLLKNHADFYTNHVAFYLDGVSFVHKYNPLQEAEKPKARIWRRPGEGLQITAKGTKNMAGGRRLNLIVAIAYGQGVILQEQYDKMNGIFFAEFVKNNFNLLFGKAGPKQNGQRLFVMDNDPSQTSYKALSEISKIEGVMHKIPPRSPDLNPIENIFHLVKKDLDKEALECEITSENFQQFKDRVMSAFNNIPVNVIDKTIESMPKRINNIVQNQGNRSKY